MEYWSMALIAGMLALAFAINAGIMWFFSSYRGFSPVLIAGIIGVGHATNSIFKKSNRLKFPYQRGT
jgi:F0F1-type ATP synthase assembly protein I